MQNFRAALVPILFFSALLFAGTQGYAQQAATQVIDLHPGWNLISMQVGGGITPAAFKAALDNPTTAGVDESDRLIEVWSFQPSGTPSVPGTWQTYQPTVAAFPSDLTTMQPSKGY